jgi:acyl-coenzyme A thioesterase PaaI-like protein
MNVAPAGFELIPMTSPFVARAGVFYSRDEPNGRRTIGTFIGHEQSNSEGVAHGGFLLTFADFAITIVTIGITLTMTVDFLRPVKIGKWIEAQIEVRKSSATLIFADTIVTCEDRDVLRAGGLFRPFEKRD